MQIDQTGFKDWMSFLPYNLIWRKSPLIQKLSQELCKAFNQHGTAENTKKYYLGVNYRI